MLICMPAGCDRRKGLVANERGMRRMLKATRTFLASGWRRQPSSFHLSVAQSLYLANSLFINNSFLQACKQQ